jgi:hypothetical protein
MTDTAIPIIFKVLNKKENLKILIPSADAYKVSSYTAETSKLHFSHETIRKKHPSKSEIYCTYYKIFDRCVFLTYALAIT